jgi:hypothetical protein
MVAQSLFMEDARHVCTQLIHISLGKEMDHTSFEMFISKTNYLFHHSAYENSNELELQKLVFSNLLFHLKSNKAIVCDMYEKLNKLQRFSPEIKSCFRFVRTLII